MTREHSSASAAIVVGATAVSLGPQDSYIVDRRCCVGSRRSLTCPAMTHSNPNPAPFGPNALDGPGEWTSADIRSSGESGDRYGEPGEHITIEAVPGPYVGSDGSDDVGVPKNAEMI